jgi:hypothetical protein
MTFSNPEEMWAELDRLGAVMAGNKAEFKALDRSTKGVLALCIAKINEPGSFAAKEAKARSDPQFVEHMDKLHKAELAAVLSEVAYNNFETYVGLRRTQAATRRAEMNLR